MKNTYKVVLNFGDLSEICTDELNEIQNIVGEESYSTLLPVLDAAGISIVEAPLITFNNVLKFALLLKLYSTLDGAENAPDIYIMHNGNMSELYTTDNHIDKTLMFSFEDDVFNDDKYHYRILMLNGNIISIYKASRNSNYRLLLDSQHSLISADHELKPNVYEILSEIVSDMKAISGIIDIDENKNIKFVEKFNSNESEIKLTPGFNVHNLAKAIISINESCVKAQDLLTQSINKYKSNEIENMKFKIESKILSKINLPDKIKLNTQLKVDYDGIAYSISCEFDGYVLTRKLPNILGFTDIDCLHLAEQYRLKAIQLFLQPIKE